MVVLTTNETESKVRGRPVGGAAVAVAAAAGGGPTVQIAQAECK